MNKRKWKVKVTMWVYNSGVLSDKIEKELETWAVSKEKAESNARYRTEGTAYWFEEYGSDAYYRTYTYDAIPV